jgi:hypothetical protein
VPVSARPSLTIKPAPSLILGLLGVAFVVLKLCNVITWSWWLVTIPFWGPPALVLAVLFCVGVTYVVASSLSRKGR